MSEVEIKQMQKKIEAGIQLARKRLIEKTKKEDGTLVVIRDGKVVQIPARELRYPAAGIRKSPGPHGPALFASRPLRSRIPAVSANTLANPYLISYKILSTPIYDTQPRTVALSSSPKYALQANIATKQAAGIAYPRTLQKKSGIPAHFSVSAV